MVRNHIITMALLASAALAAADMTGTVSAAKGLQLNGQAVPVAGTKQWPVGTGDSLKSDATPVVLTMKDGSRIVLGQNSQAKLEAGVVRLLTGTMEYQVAPRSTLQVAVNGNTLPNRTGVASTLPASSPAARAVAVPMTPSAVLTPTTLVLPPVSRRAP